MSAILIENIRICVGIHAYNTIVMHFYDLEFFALQEYLHIYIYIYKKSQLIFITYLPRYETES